MFNKKNRWRNFSFLVIALALTIESAFACTGISIHYKNNYFLGKNHDWINKETAIVINPRGMTNHDPLYKRHNKLLKWKSKYGSITVNLVEKNKVLPGAMVGMNEKGLGVLALWQINAKYPTKPTKPVISTDLLAKYFLDNAAAVPQAIQLAKQIDVEPSTLSDMDAAKVAKTLGIDRKYISDIDLHLFLQDEKGRAAVIEYVNGKLVIDSGKSLPILAISNSVYADSINYIKQFKAFGGIKALPGEFDSLSRFAKAVYALKVMPSVDSKQQAVSYLFNALSYAQSHAPDTQWTALFNLSDKILYLRSIDNQKIRIVRLRKFNLSKGEPLRFLSINNNLSGYVESEFKTLHQPNVISQVAADFNRIEQRADGKLGVFAINTTDYQTIAYNADVRFPMCSTAKVMAVSAILHHSMSNPSFLNEKIYYTKADIIPSGYTPITQQHIKDSNSA